MFVLDLAPTRRERTEFASKLVETAARCGYFGDRHATVLRQLAASTARGEAPSADLAALDGKDRASMLEVLRAGRYDSGTAAQRELVRAWAELLEPVVRGDLVAG